MGTARMRPTAMRVARPVRAIGASVRFYVDLLGLEHLGGFNDHEGFDGAFVGLRHLDWHVEFTTSPSGSPEPTPTHEDLLVLYLENEELMAAVERLTGAGVEVVEHQNPYWASVGAAVVPDPDGYLVVLCPAAAWQSPGDSGHPPG